MSYRFGRHAASSTPRALGSLLPLRMVPHRSEGALSNTLHIYPPPLDVVLGSEVQRSGKSIYQDILRLFYAGSRIRTSQNSFTTRHFGE